jgi:Flp pilus assembly protein TadG
MRALPGPGRPVLPVWALRNRRGRRDARDGGSTIVELVIVFPALLLCVMMTIDFGIWMHARQLAQAAADDGLTQAQQLNASAAQGQAEARTQLAFLAGSTLTNPTITATRNATTASISVDATAISVLPFFTLTVHERVTGPIERFVPAP